MVREGATIIVDNKDEETFLEDVWEAEAEANKCSGGTALVVVHWDGFTSDNSTEASRFSQGVVSLVVG